MIEDKLPETIPNNLLALISNDANQAKRFEQKKVQLSTDKKNLTGFAEEFLTHYSREIEEGTKKKQLLLERGAAQGKTEAQVMSEFREFIPSKETPILNFLFFSDRDKNIGDGQTYENKIEVLQESDDLGKDLEELREHYDYKYGKLHDSYEAGLHDSAPPEMESFIYENMNHETFKKIKKLKALTKSPNEAEAFQAYRKCLEFCEKYNLDFDRIPS